jgi:hypothetical protein
VILLSGNEPICAITLCEISVAAKMENITAAAAIVSIDDLANRVFLFVLLELINLIANRLY